MPSLRRLWAGKWSPAILYGFIRGDDIPAGAIEHEHMQQDYIENTFGGGRGHSPANPAPLDSRRPTL